MPEIPAPSSYPPFTPSVPEPSTIAAKKIADLEKKVIAAEKKANEAFRKIDEILQKLKALETLYKILKHGI